MGIAPGRSTRSLGVMTYLRKFFGGIRELNKKNGVVVLVLLVAFIPTYFVATQFTTSDVDAIFISFVVSIVIGVSFGPFVRRFLARPRTNKGPR